MGIEATVIVAKCGTAQKTYGIRVERRNNEWYRTWAFKVNEKSAKREGFDKTVINGKFIAGEEYNGCPYCGKKDFIKCGCGKVSCWSGENIIKCAWCGARGEISRVDKVELNSSVNF
jgi:DNA-directed RNA polymerase subunit RPC12/RpoP